MRILGSKKRFAIVATTTAAVLIGGGVAVAYWTTTGSGNGSATAGSDVSVTVTQTNTITGLYPGGPAVPIDLNITPDAPAQPSYISTVAVTITGVGNAGCTAADFAVTDGTIGANVPAGGANYAGATTGASVQLVETGSNQNPCKGTSVTLHFAAS